MPSKSKAQHNFMAMCSNKQITNVCPPVKVAKEFIAADKLKKSRLP